MYCFVENSQIVDGPRNIPKSWRNISGLNLLSDPELLALGWYPVTLVGNDLVPSETEVREGPVFTINADSVTATWTIRPKTQAELDADAAAFDAVIEQELAQRMGKILFRIVNEIQLLKGNSELTPAQFKAWYKANMT